MHYNTHAKTVYRLKEIFHFSQLASKGILFYSILRAFYMYDAVMVFPKIRFQVFKLCRRLRTTHSFESGVLEQGNMENMQGGVP